MLVKYIDSDYIINTLQKKSWAEVEEPDFYILMASNRVKSLIFPSEQGDPNNLDSYNEEQKEAIKLATSIYTFWYFDTNYDFTSGSVSVNFGGASMSESKTYNGEMVLPNVFDILKQANLIPTTETFIFNEKNDLYNTNKINKKEFKELQQEVERQADLNIKQDAKIIDIYDKLERKRELDLEKVKENIEIIKQEQEEQNKEIETNSNNIATIKNDLGDLGNQVVDINNKVELNKTNIDKVNKNLEDKTNEIKQTINELDNKFVHLDKDEPIRGIKTFHSKAYYSVIPKFNDEKQIVSKSYVDSEIAKINNEKNLNIRYKTYWEGELPLKKNSQESLEMSLPNTPFCFISLKIEGINNDHEGYATYLYTNESRRNFIKLPILNVSVYDVEYKFIALEGNDGVLKYAPGEKLSWVYSSGDIIKVTVYTLDIK